MSIAEHLAEPKRLIVAATDAPELQEARRHLEEVAKREPKIPELIRLNRMGTAAAIQIAEKKRDAESTASSNRRSFCEMQVSRARQSEIAFDGGFCPLLARFCY
jgi:hypothetical protein